MKQNQLYLIIGALIVAVVALGIYVYREESKPDGVELRIDDSAFRSSRTDPFAACSRRLRPSRRRLSAEPHLTPP